MTKKHLLPPNSTALVRAIAKACADIERVEVPIRLLSDPDNCPLEFLPFLAWARAVDRWDENWSEKTKRKVVKDSYYVHKTKGTRASIDRLAAAMGYEFSVEEWYEGEALGPAGSFIIHLSLGSTGITQATVEEFTRLVDDTRPESRHSTILLQLEVVGDAYHFASTGHGEINTVYPKAADVSLNTGLYYSSAVSTIERNTVYLKTTDAQSAGVAYSAVRAHIIDTLEIRP